MNASSQEKIVPVAAVVALVVAAAAAVWFLSNRNDSPVLDPETGHLKVPVKFSRGHETAPVDRGRPVSLIGPALGVTPELFRQAFSNVKPAPGGTAPDHARVSENKAALMRVLSPHGVVNDRLDEVSNYYRYNPGRGEMWPTREAEAYAIVDNGTVVDFEITDPGSGYSSTPIIMVPDVADFQADVELSFGRDLDSNGSVTAIRLMNSGTPRDEFE